MDPFLRENDFMAFGHICVYKGDAIPFKAISHGK